MQILYPPFVHQSYIKRLSQTLPLEVLFSLPWNTQKSEILLLIQAICYIVFASCMRRGKVTIHPRFGFTYIVGVDDEMRAY